MPTSLPSHRASRSRFSSPHQAANGSADHTKLNGMNAQKAMMARWLEPPVQSKASYQEAGLMRHGVVEQMAPLGTLPKAAASKKAAAQEPAPTRKIILKRPAPVQRTPPAPVALEEEEDFDMDVDADLEPEPEVPAPPRRSLASRELDEDYTPKSSSSHQQSSRAKGSRRRSVTTQQSTGRNSSVSHQAPTPVTPTKSGPQPSGEAAAVNVNRDVADKVVELAVEEAIRHFRYPTAWALRTLYDENSSNPQFVSMIEDVFQQTADADTVDEFTRLIHEKKREGKKDNKGCYYFVPPSTNNRFTPHKPKAAPYANLVKLKIPKAALDSDAHVSKKLKTNNGKPAKPNKLRSSTAAPATSSTNTTTTTATTTATSPTPTPNTPTVSKTGSSSAAPASASASAAKMSAAGAHGAPSSAASSPSNVRSRASSVDSSSSLSSAKSVELPEDLDDEDDDVFGGVPVERSLSTAAAETIGISTNTPAASQPIATRRRSVAAKKNGDVSPAATPISPTATAHAGMPGAAAEGSAKEKEKDKGSSSPAPPPPFGIKFPSRVGVLDENDRKSRLRRETRYVTATAAPVSESFIRSSAVLHERETPTSAARTTRSSLKRAQDEADDEAISPTTISGFPLLGPPSSAANSRAGTPAPRKRPRTGLRVKTSPMKRRAGPSAGVPRASGERSSPVGNGGGHNQDENDDYCSSCGGNGELVCCDGCTRSFHFMCVDPPLPVGKDNDLLPDEWFCNVCAGMRNPAEFPSHPGAFGSLMSTLDKKNSSAFRLPGDVRDYFEGVKTGADGEYENIVVAAPKSKKKGGYEDAPDFFKIRDADGNAVLCHSCHQSAADNRAILPCSLCGLYWHLDCVDPPMAHPPVLRTWRCPAHVDDLLAVIPAALGPAHRFRKIKGASVIKPAYSRGMVNNGFIDIDVDEESDKDETGWKDVKTYGRIYKLNSRGIKLDFMSQVRKSRKGKKRSRQVMGSAPATIPAVAPTVVVSDRASVYLADRRAIDEAQAAHNLTSLSQSTGLALDRSGELINALLSEADSNVIAMMAQGNAQHLEQPKSLTSQDRTSLEAMKAMIEQLLRQEPGHNQESAGPAPENTASTSNGESVSSPARGQASSIDSCIGNGQAKASDGSSTVAGEGPANGSQETQATAASEPEQELSGSTAGDVPIATPLTTSNEKGDEPLDDEPMADADAVFAADNKKATLLATAHPASPAGDKVEAKDVMPTPSTSPTTANKLDMEVDLALEAQGGYLPGLGRGSKGSIKGWDME